MTEQYLFRNKQWLIDNLKKYKTVIKISRATGYGKTSLYRWIKKYELSNMIEHPAQNCKYTFNDSYFENIDTPEKAYWLGMFMADGCLRDGNRKSYSVSLGLKKSDIYHVERFAKAINLNKDVYINKNSMGTLTIHSKKMYFDLISHGVYPHKTRNEVFPNLSNNLISHFIRGFFDGDGTIYSRNQTNPKRKRSLCCIGWVCGNKQFIDKLLEVLEKECGAKLGCFYKTNHDVYEIKTEAINKCKRIIEYMYKDATIYLERKHEKAMKFLSMLSESGRIARIL